MISRTANRPRSCIDIRCRGSGQPEALAKVDCVIPSSAARSVISRAKASSLPASASATTTQASLPDCTMIPLIRSSTVGRSVSSRNIVLPPIALARDETENRVSRPTRPSRNASNSMFSVISFDIEAGGIGTSAFFSRRTVSVVRS